MTRTHARTAAVLLAALALIPAAGRAHGATAHRRPRAQRCSSGRFLVQAQPLIAGSQTPAPDVIVLGTRELALGSGCPPAPRHLVETRKRTTLHASWAGCQGLKGKVRLTARIDASCETMVGTLRARRFKRRFTAKAARCGDGVVEVGEECEPPGSAGCDASCHLADASIVPLPGRIQLPTGLAIDPTTLSVRDLLGSAVPTAAGQFSLPAVGAEGTLAVVVGPTGAPLLLGWLDRDHPVISARTTAETFAFAAVGGTMVSADAQAKVRLLLDALPEIQPLADAIEKSLAANPDLSAAATADVQAALRAVSAAVVPQQTAASRSTLWWRLASWFVSPAVAALRVDPSSGAQSGLSLNTAADAMNPTVPLNAFYLTNTYRRPAHAFVELVSLGIIPDEHSKVTPFPLNPPYQAYREFPVAAVAALQDTAGTIGQVVFGAVAGQPTAFVPVDSPVPPQALPINIPGVMPANAVEATYAVLVVGAGGVDTNRSAGYVISDVQLAKQQEIGIRYFIFDLVVPAALFTLDSRLGDRLLQAPKDSGLGSAVSQFIKHFMTDAPDVFRLSQQGLWGQALLKGIEALAGDSDLQHELANLLVQAYLDRALQSGLGAINNAQAFLDQVKGALATVHVSDQVLNSVNMSATWANFLTAHTADAWTVTVRPSVVRLLPPSAALLNGQAASFTATVPELSGSGEFVGYRWSNTASVGHLTDGLSGHVDAFTSTHAAVTYTANAMGMGTDTITVEAFEGDPNHDAPSIGTASAAVSVGMTTTTTTLGTTTTTPTTSTTLPLPGRQFNLFPSTCCANSTGDVCNMDVSLLGQSCSVPYVLCICRAAGRVVPNIVFYASPGDSVSIECFTCNYQCADYQLALNNSIPIFPLEQVCLPSPPPANTVTEIVAEMSAPVPFPPTFAPQYCCQLPAGHCSGGANDGATCADPSVCSGGVCAGRCFEYTLGLPGDQDCAQMGGSSLATYCGGKGTCGAD